MNAVRSLLLDSDVFQHLRSLELLGPCLSALRVRTAIYMTSYAARHELNMIASEVAALEQQGLVEVRAVVQRTEAMTRYRAFQRVVDKGEAEALAWALEHPLAARPVFCSLDGKARRFAEEQRVPVTNTFGVVVSAIRLAGFAAETARGLLTPWDLPNQERGKPAGWRGFDAELAHRGAIEEARFATEPDVEDGT